jgi:hypothetical protein
VTEETTQPENIDPILSITLKVAEVNIVLAGLQELQFKIADPIMKNIILQAQTQLGQVQPTIAEETA